MRLTSLALSREPRARGLASRLRWSRLGGSCALLDSLHDTVSGRKPSEDALPVNSAPHAEVKVVWASEHYELTVGGKGHGSPIA